MKRFFMLFLCIFSFGLHGMQQQEFGTPCCSVEKDKELLDYYVQIDSCINEFVGQYGSACSIINNVLKSKSTYCGVSICELDDCWEYLKNAQKQLDRILSTRILMHGHAEPKKVARDYYTKWLRMLREQDVPEDYLALKSRFLFVLVEFGTSINELGGILIEWRARKCYLAKKAQTAVVSIPIKMVKNNRLYTLVGGLTVAAIGVTGFMMWRKAHRPALIVPILPTVMTPIGINRPGLANSRCNATSCHIISCVTTGMLSSFISGALPVAETALRCILYTIDLSAVATRVFGLMR